MIDIDEKIKKLGILIPKIQEPKFSYIPGRKIGNLIYVSGQTPTKYGKLVYKGKVSKDISIEDAYKAARLAALNCIGELKFVLGDLIRVKKIIKLNGFVASSKGFVQQPKVVNGASDLLLEIWGDKGSHARKAIGVYELPGGAPVEIELIAEID